jgi:hypothetical protein
MSFAFPVSWIQTRASIVRFVGRRETVYFMRVDMFAFVILVVRVSGSVLFVKRKSLGGCGCFGVDMTGNFYSFDSISVVFQRRSSVSYSSHGDRD